ncbi:MAG: hypothetical protein JST40_12510 [Armatimonadetes bacterium]|nr:hypothetical protein [Armatimonadota bacterium]
MNLNLGAKTRRFLLTAACTVVMGAAQVAFAFQTPATRVDINLKDADLRAAIELLRVQTGLQFVFAPGLEELPRITLALKECTAEEALTYICKAGGVFAERGENGVYVITKIAPSNQVNVSTQPSTPVRKKERKVEKIKVMKGDPEQIIKMLTSVYVFDPDRGIREMNNLSREYRDLQSNKLPGATVIVPGVGAVNQTPGTSYPTSNGSVSDSAINPSAGNGDILLPGETANQAGGGRPGGGGGGLGQGGGNNGPGGGGGLGNGNGGGGTGADSQLQPGTGLVPEDIDQIFFDPTDNSIVVQGEEEAIRKLRSLIAQFDQAPKQVIVKVEFITTSQSLERSFGMDWLYQRGAIGAGNRPGVFARNSDPIFINYATGNVTTRLRTLLLQGDGKAVQAPLIRTLNNQTASVGSFATTTIFIPQTTIGGGGTNTTYVPTTLQIQNLLVVRPRINNDGTVTMTLFPQLQDYGEIRTGPDGTQIPDTLTTTIQVVARVKSGETIALAGFNRKQFTNSTQRFPILGDLPIIGQFFRTTSTKRNDQELIVFVTPIVVEDESAGGLGP